ncbi:MULTISPECIES: MFS transporter [unclassified Streptomyces]|uniref:MFS transporter n=1 Tax=unclassified Streptomyces TaxID=2593676 RepID=UPI00037C07C5|nr:MULTISPECIES: MFS transporter [unclassified Streptomyces]MYT28057.1 MFS transporter [Streptomyces sp. SID8354]
MTAAATYRRVLALSGPLLPVVSFLGRLPTAMCQLGTVLLVAATSGSLTTAGLVGGALAAGQTVAGPLTGRLADRHGQRPVVLVACWVNALAVAALVAAALARMATPPLTLIALLAGASVPQIGPLARTRLVALAHRAAAEDRVVSAALSLEGTLDEVSFVLGPALVGLAATVAHPAVALALAALLPAVCGTAFALHPTAAVTRPAADPSARGTRTPRPRPARTRMPRAVHAVRLSTALQGAMFGACQAGITALTERLHQPAQAGLVYAAMGVMSAAAGLSLALVPARIGLPARWRAAAAALIVLSVPLLFVGSMGALYLVVVVLGVAFAPHLITLFGLTERLVPATRLAESMAFLTSAVVGGQAVALAVSGRLADAQGPAAAFAVAVGAAVLVLVVALTTRAGARPTVPVRASRPGRGTAPDRAPAP